MSDSDIVVSVWMTTYNHEKYIAQAIESIIAQETSFRFELLIGEDCSTDATGRICQAYADKYKETIRLFRRPTNLGMTKNGLETFAEAKGKYIAICEGDDYWIDKQKLQKQVAFLETNREYSIAASKSLISIGNNVMPDHDGASEDETFDINDILIKSRFETASIILRNQPKIVLPEWFASHGSDIDALVFWMLRDGSKAYIFKEAMAVYRYHPGGATKQNNYQQKIDYYLGMLKHFNQSTNYQYDKIIRAKALSVLTAFNLYLLKYPQRIGFIARNALNYLLFPNHGGLNWKLLVKYLLPLNYNK